MSDCRRLFWLLPLLLALLAACSDLVPTGTDTADQATSAQRFLARAGRLHPQPTPPASPTPSPPWAAAPRCSAATRP